MLVAAAVCPCPPLLVPRIAAGAAAELEALRAACADALSVLAASRPDRLLVLGPVTGTGAVRHAEGASGGFHGFGVPLSVRLARAGQAEPPRAADDGAALPASLAVGAWLVEKAAWAAAPVSGLAVGEESGTEECLALGESLRVPDERLAVLALGDGSTTRTVKAPGYLDERAAPWDSAVAKALADADTEALAGLDPVTARALGCAGRAPWQVLAGAARGADLTGSLLYEEAPYGVGYFVAAWS
ncbi:MULTISPECIES: class III extradiol dioxygenase subunit B-like domain-containing protein [unclassified Streptomyces]|uniref:class III extradiol dioxygenase subunit B-like domain-containing protein n=1 Tax=unclassified Streptomyces TaxID=2593676 RepID=UPI0004C88266|nr:class III extradiol dioxygenase subunit B-like domain-containing protein [Streptomyces sp. NRRL F-5630]